MPPVSEAGADTAAPAVVVQDLVVRYNTTSEKVRRSNVRRQFIGRFRHRKSPRMVEALAGISLEVGVGEVFGIVGANGAGKSTLLRTIAGILPPTEGRIELYGRATPLLSLGVGFNRELTGRENVLLGGLANGMSIEEVETHREEVIAFAGLGDAIDSPMRTYSSGMFARLAFSVASHLDPEILLIDEALAAGDATFKRKSFDKIIELCERDCTVLIVSHGLQVIARLATRGIWLESGVIAKAGPSEEVVDAYLASRGLVDEATAMEDV